VTTAQPLARRLDGVLEALVADPTGGPPGAALVVMRDGELVTERAVGLAQVAEPGVPERRVHRDTVFDLGSITKVAVTTALVMTLVERGVLDLEAPAASWLDRFTGAGKERVTLTHLLTHRSGLWEWWPVYFAASDRSAAIDFVCSLELRYPVDSARHYSDLGFMLLGEIVRRATGEGLERVARRLVLDPLGMRDTGYLPPRSLRERIAATSRGDAYEREMISSGDPYPVAVDPARFGRWREHTLVGEVNDGNAHHAFGGIAGHAGLFSTARDLATFGQVLADGGAFRGTRIWKETTVELFTHDRDDPGQGLGFWTRRLEQAAGRPLGFGHSGFPGTELLVAPEEGLVVVLLTNRLHGRRGPRPIGPAWQELLSLVA
jgi:CubicO group peptidase (beta-lactamase class C family)